MISDLFFNLKQYSLIPPINAEFKENNFFNSELTDNLSSTLSISQNKTQIFFLLLLKHKNIIKYVHIVIRYIDKIFQFDSRNTTSTNTYEILSSIDFVHYVSDCNKLLLIITGYNTL